VKFDRLGEPAQVIDVQWGAPQSAGSGNTDALAEYRAGGTPVEVRGHDGLLSTGDGWLVWEEHPGQVVYVSAKQVPPYGYNAAALSASVLEQVAASLQPRADGGFRVTAPTGFVYVSEWPLTGFEGTHPRAAVYVGPGGAGFQVHLVDDTEQPPGSSPLLADNRRVDINGAAAMFSRFLTTPPVVEVDGAPLFDGATRYLQWIDAAGTRVTISARHLDDAQMLSIARSLVPVSAATWVHYLEHGTAPNPRVSPTTLTPGTTAAPPPGAQHFAGSYQGIEHYTLQTQRCPQLDHNLIETFTLSSGAIWNFQNLYCGTLTDTNLWHGQGTFSFTAGGGTFGGDTDVVARVPTAGGPIALHVTRGTGVYAGASGWCELDNHIRQIAFGVQEQSGMFTCDIAFNRPNAPTG
jgi:hypothetical protein